MNGESILIGTVRGRVIELEQEPGLPDGQRVQVSLKPTVRTPGDGIRASAGAWADCDDAEFNRWLEETYRARETDRRNQP